MLSDGEYSIEVDMTGGTGRAGIKSPTKLTVEKGKMKAEIEWSSPHYDYMEIDGKAYYPINTKGNSLFVVEINQLDAGIPIKAETTAMSKPYTIKYTLLFHSDSISGNNVQNTATTVAANNINNGDGAASGGIYPFVFVGVGIVIVAAGVFARNFLGKKKKNEVVEKV